MTEQTYEQRMTELRLRDGLAYVERYVAETEALGLADVPTMSYATYESRGYTSPWAASKPRLRCHGCAAMPPTPEAAQRLADGLVEPTVWWTPARGEEPRVEHLSTFTGRGKQRGQRGQAVVADVPAVVMTTDDAVQPAMRHDYSA